MSKSTLTDSQVAAFKGLAADIQDKLNNTQDNRVYRVYFDKDFFSCDSQVSAFVFQDETENWNFSVDFDGNLRFDTDVMKSDFSLSLLEVAVILDFAKILSVKGIYQK